MGMVEGKFSEMFGQAQPAPACPAAAKLCISILFICYRIGCPKTVPIWGHYSRDFTQSPRNSLIFDRWRFFVIHSHHAQLDHKDHLS